MSSTHVTSEGLVGSRFPSEGNDDGDGAWKVSSEPASVKPGNNSCCTKPAPAFVAGLVADDGIDCSLAEEQGASVMSNSLAQPQY